MPFKRSSGQRGYISPQTGQEALQYGVYEQNLHFEVMRCVVNRHWQILVELFGL